MENKTDIELVELLQGGNEDAFDELYRRHHKSLYYVAYRMCNNQEDAKDAVQSTFMQMHKSIQSLRMPKYFRLWMTRILSGKCKDIFSRNKTITIDMDNPKITNHYVETRNEFNPNNMMREKTDKDILMHMVDNLPYPQKEAIVLAYFQKLSMQEIADVTGEAIGTIKSRIFLAKKTLRKSVEHYEKENEQPLSFHSLSLDSFLISAFAYSYQQMNPGSVGVLSPNHSKFSNLFGSSAVKILAVTALSVTTLGVGGAVLHNFNNRQSIDKNQLVDPQKKSIIVHNKEIDNEQDAYFTLMNWAVNQEKLSFRTKEEASPYKPLYDFLKEKKGSFWKGLENSGMSTSFETIFK